MKHPDLIKLAEQLTARLQILLMDVEDIQRTLKEINQALDIIEKTTPKEGE